MYGRADAGSSSTIATHQPAEATMAAPAASQLAEPAASDRGGAATR